jgi:tetratricopeptide (TPR) repeat protein
MIRRAICLRLALRTCALAFSTFVTLLFRADCLAQGESDVSEAQPVKTEVDSGSPIPFCLKTEFFPAGGDENTRPDRLAREIVRQAILMTARDTLGLTTRDESLQEPFPAAIIASRRMMNTSPRARKDGKLQLSLWAGTSTMLGSRRGRGNPEGGTRPWSTEVTFTATPYQNYLSMLATLEPMTRKELADAVRGFGFEGQAPEPNPANKPPAAVENALQEMNFVSPYMAVRAAHEALAKNGESPEWLGVLVRGYANLSLTTFHHWTCANEVFAARSLLYAERLVNTRPKDPLAHAHRAYARAIIGLHAAALAELKTIDTLRQENKDTSELPGWLAPVAPFCKFEREPLVKVGKDYREYTPLVQRLAFELDRVVEDPRWLMETAEPTIKACPEEYGVYAALARNDSLLSVKRTGAHYGPAAMGHFLPARVAALQEVPKAVRDAAGGQAKGVPGAIEADTTGPFSAVVANIARAFVAANEAEPAPAEPSWAVLGKLIEEEQFTQVANFFGVATDATETPLGEMVDGVWPIVKDHRFAWYVKSFSARTGPNRSRWAEIIGRPQFPDPRGNMYRMFYVAWNVDPNQNRNGRGRLGSWQAALDSSITLPGLLFSLDQANYYWWNLLGVDRQEQYATDLLAVSPYSPQALRFKIRRTENASAAQIADWEEKAGDDPIVFITLGGLYAGLQKYEDAARCYQQSIELSPSYGAYVGLANSYHSGGQPELWQPTLERFLDEPSLGLEHGWIHQMIANDYIEKGDWQSAESHALGAAQTWSAWGLLLAAEVYEGLGRWEESEKWTRDAAHAYPSGSGLTWYFWCRRTGRGALAEARKLAESILTPEWITSNTNDSIMVMTYYILENDLKKALPFAQKQVENGRQSTPELRVHNQGYLAVLAHELKEEEIEKSAVAEIRRIVSEEERLLNDEKESLGQISIYFCDVLDGKEIDPQALAEITEKIDKLPEDSRRNFATLLGRALELRGDTNTADKLYRTVVDKTPFNKMSRNMAGHFLAERHGTSRP